MTRRRFSRHTRRPGGGGCYHSFRATGIAVYLQNGGTVEKAQQIFGSPV
jgi:hypothetical protein